MEKMKETMRSKQGIIMYDVYSASVKCTCSMYHLTIDCIRLKYSQYV